MPNIGDKYYHIYENRLTVYKLTHEDSDNPGDWWALIDGDPDGLVLIWEYELLEDSNYEYVLHKIKDDKHLLELRLKYA